MPGKMDFAVNKEHCEACGEPLTSKNVKWIGLNTRTGYTLNDDEANQGFSHSDHCVIRMQ